MNAGTSIHTFTSGVVARGLSVTFGDRQVPIPSESVPVEWLIDDMERTGILVRRPRSKQRVRREQSVHRRMPRSLSREVPRYRTRPPPRRSGTAAAEGVGVAEECRVPVPSGLLRGRIVARRSVQRQIWEAAEETDSILQFHMRPSHADRLASIASRHPNVQGDRRPSRQARPVNGRQGDHPILALADRPNTWSSRRLPRSLQRWTTRGPVSSQLVARLCERFGTDRPLIGGRGSRAEPGSCRWNRRSTSSGTIWTCRQPPSMTSSGERRARSSPSSGRRRRPRRFDSASPSRVFGSTEYPRAA